MFMRPEVASRTTRGAEVEMTAPGQWRLGIPQSEQRRYRWAQLDDYMERSRSAFRWSPPLSLTLRARVSHQEFAGTWGFGLWNDPFNAGIGLKGTARRLPSLPNAAWFFHASPPNHLALRDDHPARGFLAATFCSPRVPGALLAIGALGLPLLAWPFLARHLRRLGRRLVVEDAALLELDATEWHTYGLHWCSEAVRFAVDGEPFWDTAVTPRPPLGLVLWIDNQYAAFPATGRVRLGTLPTLEPAWLDLADIRLAEA